MNMTVVAAGSIGLLKVIMTGALCEMPVFPEMGMVETLVGAVWAWAGGRFTSIPINARNRAANLRSVKCKVKGISIMLAS